MTGDINDNIDVYSLFTHVFGRLKQESRYLKKLKKWSTQKRTAYQPSRCSGIRLSARLLPSESYERPTIWLCQLREHVLSLRNWSWFGVLTAASSGDEKLLAFRGFDYAHLASFVRFHLQ